MHRDDIKILPIPSFNDNYIWLIVNTKNNICVAIDPGDATLVLATLEKLSLKLSAILITHYHADHINGVSEILDHYAVPVYQPNNCIAGNFINIPDLHLKFQVIATPGHTLDHIVYYGNNMLFSGDTLFAGGCGKLFEGSAAQMLHSLQKLALLNHKTKVYCAHEYTKANLKFAIAIEPNNPALTARLEEVTKLIDNGTITLPSNIDLELNTNPFLRTNQAVIRNNVSRFYNKEINDDLEVFGMLRTWKDKFV